MDASNINTGLKDYQDDCFHNSQDDWASILSDPEEFRKAFVASEILNRKY